MRKSILHETYAIAVNKLGNHPEFGRFIHFTFIIQDNKIIEWGRNNKAIPAKHLGYHARINNTLYAPKTHSEIDAYRKAKGLLIRNKSFEIVNIRLNKEGKVRISKPCCCCFVILKELGCSKFYYSSEVGFLQC